MGIYKKPITNRYLVNNSSSWTDGKRVISLKFRK